MSEPMCGELVLWALFLLPTLLPDLAAGVTLSELLAITCHFAAATVLAWKYAQDTKIPQATWLLVGYLAISFVGLTHDPIGFFLPYFAGGLAFTGAVVVGSCLPSRLEERFPQWLFVFVSVAAVLDIALDYTGILQHRPGAGQWVEGKRGIQTAQSFYGAALAPIAAAIAAFSPSRRWRMVGSMGFLLAFYHVAVIGQGRGAAILAILGILVVLASSLRAFPTSVIALAPLLAVILLGGVEESLQPFMNRVESQELGDVDRLEHAETGERLLLNMSTGELLTGIWYKKVVIANGGLSIHNAFFDIVTRFGLVASIPWALFYLANLFAALVSIVIKSQVRMHTFASAIAIQIVVAFIAGPIFVNWRACVIPGLCSGLVLRALRAPLCQGSCRLSRPEGSGARRPRRSWNTARDSRQRWSGR